MTWDERVHAVSGEAPGVTDRQAAFLVTVMLHAGVCMDRHYCTFAGIPHGRKTHDFFRLLVDRGYATAQSCRNNSARVFHIHYKPLYAAIGEPDHRHRKPTPLPRAIERLMVLDAVLADRSRTWLATEQDKLTHFMLTHRIPRQDLPGLIFRSQDTETVRSFPDKLPIGIDRDGEYTFLYLVTRPGPVDFRAFLERHAELLRALRAWFVSSVGDRPIAEVSAFHVERWKGQRAEQVKRSTVNRELNIVRGCFSRAVEWGRLAVSPL